MIINITYDPSCNNAPAGFTACVAAAVQFYETTFTNPVTINIDVGYGEVVGNVSDLQTVGGALGRSQFLFGPAVTYTQLINALTTEGAPGAASLPSSAPTSDTLQISRAEEKALGLLTDNSSTVDGWVGFNTTAAFNYDPNNRAIPGEFDFVGVVEHEISEVMGRLSNLNQSGLYAPIDLFRYSAPGVHQFGTGDPSYFSLDDGTTNLNFWNNFTTGNKGDLADWAPSAAPDSFLDNSNPGVTNSVTRTDIHLMQALGWTVPTATVNVHDVSVAENASISVTSLITSVSNPSGDSVTAYAFWDAGNGNGHFVLNGTVQPDRQWIVVDASNLNNAYYVGGSSPGSDTLYVDLFDATTLKWSPFPSLTATTTSGGFIDNLTADQQLELIYVGYFNRCPDLPGFTHWEGDLVKAPAFGQSAAVAMTNVADSFAPQPETDALYPILAPGVVINPNSASDQLAVQTLVQNVYQNLFDRTVTTTELTSHQGAGYWVDEILQGIQPLGKAILAIANGVQGSDSAVLSDKIAVSDYWLIQTKSNNIGLTAPVPSSVLTEAKNVLSGVTADPSTVTSAEHAIDSFISANTGHAAGATSVVNLVGLSSLNHTEISHV